MREWAARRMPRPILKIKVQVNFFGKVVIMGSARSMEVESIGLATEGTWTDEEN